jgi:hypothetical protein
MTEFTLQSKRWYGWQMLPGYVGERCIPYCCPIYMGRVTPKKTGKGILKIAFWNTGYAQGVQDFELDLKILHRASDYLVARLLYGNEHDQERCAVISHIEFGWIERFCPNLWHNHPPHNHSSVSIYLDGVFGISHG